MFILDTIKPVNDANRVLETPKPIRYVSLLFTLIAYVLLIINLSQESSEKDIFSAFILIFICTNMYFLLFHRTIKLSNDKSKLIINYKFIGLIIKQMVFELNKIEKIFYEDRRMGQTVSAKYRFFIRFNGKDYNVGVVNHIDKAKAVQNLFDDLIQQG